MTRDEFDAWRVNPVTRWIFRGIENAQEAERAEWIRRTWDVPPRHGEQPLLMALIELKTRADALGELIDNEFETWSEWNGEQPDPDDGE